MLRRKLSAGALRAAASTPVPGVSSALSHQFATGATAGKNQTANLASAVLLNSQRRWKEETIVTLKGELKRRGLSQTGNKSALVARLQSADASSLLPPVPAMPSTAAAVISKKPTSARPISSTRSASAASGSAAPSKPAGADQPPISTETVTSAGPAVISQKVEAAKTEEIDAEIVDSPPGLPELENQVPKGLDLEAAERDSVKIPQPVEEVETAQIIPLEPDNFRSNRQLPAAEPGSSDLSGPKLVVIAESSVGPDNVAHAIHDDLPPSSSSDGSGSGSGSSSAADAASNAAEAAKDLANSLPSLSDAMASALSAPGRGLSALNLGAALPEIGAPAGNGNGGEGGKYKANSEPYTSEERTGLYIFGGIIALGLALGGGKKDKSKGKDGKGGSVKGKVGEVVDGLKGGKVKGDAKWEQASGAEIVGHGTRKA